MISVRWSNSEGLPRIELFTLRDWLGSLLKLYRRTFDPVVPIEQIVQPKDKDLNTELFGDNDDRRNKVVNRNNQPRRNIVVQQSQPQQQQYQDTKYIKYEYQQEKEIVYDIQGMSHIWLMFTDDDVTSGWADFDIFRFEYDR